MFQDDFCQQVFEVLVEIFRKECQNRLGRGQVLEDCHPGEAVQSLEQLQERRGAMGSDEQGAGGRGRGACHTLAPSFKLSPRSPEAPGTDADAHVPRPASKFTCCFEDRWSCLSQEAVNLSESLCLWAKG